MAKLIGVGISTLNIIENGKIPKRLSCRVLVRIHSVFGIKPQNMFKAWTDL